MPAGDAARPGRGPTRAAGAGGAVLALAWLWVVSAFAPSVPFPASALADRLVRLAPGDLATAAIEALGHWGQRALTAGVVAGAVALGAAAWGVAAGRGGRAETGAAGTLAAVAVASSLAAPAADPNVVATVAAATTAAAVYVWTARRLSRAGATAEPDDPARRAALKRGLAWTAAAATAGGLAGWIARRLAGPDTNVAIADAVRRAPIPERASWPEIPGLSPEVTEVADHYVVDINLVQPSIEASDWSLRVHGDVEQPLGLGFAELQERFEVVEEHSVLCCVSNEVGGDLVGHSLWRGVRMRDVLEAAGVRSTARDVVLRAADGYSDSIPLERALDDHTLLAVAQNGRPLTQAHGFPCRVRIPAIYGMKNVKWLTEIEVVSNDYVGYWQQRGWSDTAVVRTQSRIDVAGDNGETRAGVATWIAGVAWAGARGISRVELSVDGGRSWSDARLRAPIGASSWRQWAYRWTPRDRGATEVVARATDGDGVVQTDDVAPPHPAGATGWHRVPVVVR